MKYIVMCGSTREPLRHLSTIYGETLLYRTIRLLKENGIWSRDIRLTPSKDLRTILLQDKLPSTLAIHNNENKLWCDCFYPMNEPCTYLFGDVVYSPKAIKTIVETETEDIEFFASAPPFAKNYSKRWAEPFAFKVVDQEHFKNALQEVRKLESEGKFNRSPIAWETWQVIKGTPINKIDYTNYTVINDYTCDVDELSDIYKFEGGDIWHTT